MGKSALQKLIANSGYCSRRQAEELIRLGKVSVNEEAAELGQRADEKDIIKINGKKIDLIEKKTYIALNKPIGYTCTNRKFKGEQNIFALLPDEFKTLHVAGRLDKNSHGLVLLTNDGDYTMRITHPRFEHEKKYSVQLRIANYELRIKDLVEKLLGGIDIGEGDGIARVKNIVYSGNNMFEIILTEGKKRQIRRMFKAVGLEVADLQRVAIGEIGLGDLKEGEWKQLIIKN